MYQTSAYGLAAKAHEGKLYGGEPYHDAHLAHVVANLVQYGYNEPHWIDAGWLHDAIEDTDITYGDIAVSYGVLVANLVWAVTGIGETRKLRNAEIYRKVTAFPLAAILKVADRIHNVESAAQLPDLGLYKMYRREQPDFADVMRQHVPAEMWARLEAAFIH